MSLLLLKTKPNSTDSHFKRIDLTAFIYMLSSLQKENGLQWIDFTFIKTLSEVILEA